MRKYTRSYAWNWISKKKIAKRLNFFRFTEPSIDDLWLVIFFFLERELKKEDEKIGANRRREKNCIYMYSLKRWLAKSLKACGRFQWALDNNKITAIQNRWCRSYLRAFFASWCNHWAFIWLQISINVSKSNPITVAFPNSSCSCSFTPSRIYAWYLFHPNHFFFSFR